MPLFNTVQGLGGAGVGARTFELLSSCRLSFSGTIHTSTEQMSVLYIHVCLLQK